MSRVGVTNLFMSGLLGFFMGKNNTEPEKNEALPDTSEHAAKVCKSFKPTSYAAVLPAQEETREPFSSVLADLRETYGSHSIQKRVVDSRFPMNSYKFCPDESSNIYFKFHTEGCIDYWVAVGRVFALGMHNRVPWKPIPDVPFMLIEMKKSSDELFHFTCDNRYGWNNLGVAESSSFNREGWPERSTFYHVMGLVVSARWARPTDTLRFDTEMEKWVLFNQHRRSFRSPPGPMSVIEDQQWCVYPCDRELSDRAAEDI